MPDRPLLDRIPVSVKGLLVLLALYLFLIGIGAMSTAMKSVGLGYVQGLLGSEAHPVVALFVGILATTLVQSSSTTTSLLVGMVASGAVPFEAAVFMVMGANIGTTVTNTIVSLGHIGHSNEFRRAFAAATVHDFFNLIVVALLFPLEWATGALSWVARQLTQAFQGAGGLKLADPIKAMTKPAIGALKDCCNWISQEHGGLILLIVAILATFVALIALVKLLKSIMVTKLENLFDRVIFRSPYRALAFGFVVTVLVQSSSITTSVAVPLVAAGIITIHQVVPYTMGANIGTTVTALLAALGALAVAEPGDHDEAILALQIAFLHTTFNVFGTALLWRLRFIPIALAQGFARLAAWNRALPLVYILVAFYLVPFLVVFFGR